MDSQPVSPRIAELRRSDETRTTDTPRLRRGSLERVVAQAVEGREGEYSFYRKLTEADISDLEEVLGAKFVEQERIGKLWHITMRKEK